jgi:hypothetical protein
MDFRIDDRDLSAFLIYAARERNLDASQRAVSRYARTDEHLEAVNALRELNKRMLFRETQQKRP